MSKGAFNGLLKGKLGNTIFYKVTNSSDKEKQGQRQYVASIANPRTAPQATQRMRMKPAINFYRGLADLLDHSWEGVKYGALSRQKFMQLALSPTLAGIPYVDKGESRFIPGNYPLSMGSVGADITPSPAGDEGASFSINVNITGSEVDGPGTFTWGQWSQALINGANGLRDGDEITFVAVVQNGELFVPVHTYVVLDVQSSLPVNQVFANARIAMSAGGATSTSVEIFRSSEYGEEGNTDVSFNGTCVAAGIIVSRHPSRTSTTWLRSTSSLVCSQSFMNTWMSADRFAAALVTYQNSATDLTSDWLLNQAENQGSTSGGSGGGIIQNFTLEMRSVTPISGGTAVQLAYYNDGTKEGFICNSAVLSELEPPRIVVDTPYTLSGNSLAAAATLGVAVETKVIGLDEFPSIRTKIAQFYTFA